MPRKSRRKSLMGMYHVMTRGIDKLAVFEQTREKIRILSLIRENYEEYGIQIHAYCIMSNHIHLLIKAELKELASFMAKVLASYAIYYNYKHDRVGYVFQNRFKSQCIDEESYYWNCLRYIHMNPIHANLCPSIRDYKYSSIQEYNGIKAGKSKLLHEDAFTMCKGRFWTPEDFFAFHKQTCREVFVDMSKDELNQKKSIAIEILRDMQNECKIQVEEIFDYFKLREELDRKIRDTLQLSGRAAKEIRELIKVEVIKQ